VIALLFVAGFSLLALAQNQQAPVTGPDPQSVVGPPNGQPLTGDVLEARTKEVASLLRCPVCQGLSVWDSPATMAVNMKHEVHDLLAKGYDQDQILRYFENSYGEFVLLAPPKKGINILVWVLPIVFFVAGGFIVWRMMSHPKDDAGETDEESGTDEPEEEGLPGRDTLPDDPELAKYVLAVRELAYGWEGGKSPSSDAPAEGDR